MIVDIWRVKLAALEGLLGNVFPELRAVCVDSEENLIKICFYVDGEITNEQKKCCKLTQDSITADFIHLKEIKFEMPIIRLDYPKPPSLMGQWVYFRHKR